MLYNVKCKGCGSYLNDEENKNGFVKNYTPKKTLYCKRCFQLIHYNIIEENPIQVDDIISTLKDLDLKKHLIFMVIDIFDIPSTIIKEINTFDNLVIIVNKMDLLPKNYIIELTQKNIIENLNNFGFQNNDVIFCSSKYKSSTKIIKDYIIKAHYNKMKSIFIGKSNVGKSSIIKRISDIEEKDSKLTISPYLNTTLNFQKIKISNDLIVIDTPGFINDKSILNFIDYKNTKKIICAKIKKVRTFSLHENRTYNIDNLVRVDVETINNSSITFYINDTIKIISSKIKDNNNLLKNTNSISYKGSINLTEHIFELDDSKKENICISGLGLISLNKCKKVKIILSENIEVNLMSKQII